MENASTIFTFLTSFFYPLSSLCDLPLVWPVFHDIAVSVLVYIPCMRENMWLFYEWISGIKYIHNVQPSQLGKFRILSSCKIGPIYSLNSTSLPNVLPAPGNRHSSFCFSDSPVSMPHINGYLKTFVARILNLAQYL
jgi:hypothetical protein